jgi:sugar (pentulose or hexulose) kinase
MSSTPVIAILDVGKSNKKLFLFDQSYKIVWEESRVLPETRDEDGDPCEDLEGLQTWIEGSLLHAKKQGELEIRAVNFSAYGASFVHIDGDGKPLLPLYNYLKPFPGKIKSRFYNEYGGDPIFSMQTASPVLGSLNSGMQLYRIKYEKPQQFESIKYSLHLPQYLSLFMTGKPFSDITSIGCHTNLWNFSQNSYHEWVRRESILSKLAPISPAGTVQPVLQDRFDFLPTGCLAGIGLHDSSASMIPYLESFSEPFVLISTGTWCISMNPFNQEPLTIDELQNDCLCFLTFAGRPMKASRLFAGHLHDREVDRIAVYFSKEKDHCQTIGYDPSIVFRLQNAREAGILQQGIFRAGDSAFSQRDLSVFSNFEEAYHRLLMDIVDQQLLSTKRILGNNIKRIFVDGGFSKNPLYMQLLAVAFPSIEIFTANITQASALGAALAIHKLWNPRPLPASIIELRHCKKEWAAG